MEDRPKTASLKISGDFPVRLLNMAREGINKRKIFGEADEVALFPVFGVDSRNFSVYFGYIYSFIEIRGNFSAYFSACH
ncbi:hypothetical protein B14911_09887 [Bacillus sp. NRRL B-14911]|uniref:Uncharacterized protein n=1 Tax=Bacillus infantis NRRL B-14911 TaxID=1367477 RepID=U5L875_9BACI|nr:hypothetical protein N288_10630 [Bacillus infantis NRRL B-14911]EAR65876.1 hypothetical protein B14911_09887 [Bacillus sp. NRRL B-14911]